MLPATPRVPRPWVAPREGAWIEITLRTCKTTAILVAPREGAWIEIALKTIMTIAMKSRPVRARGLKYN